MNKVTYVTNLYAPLQFFGLNYFLAIKSLEFQTRVKEWTSTESVPQNIVDAILL